MSGFIFYIKEGFTCAARAEDSLVPTANPRQSLAHPIQSLLRTETHLPVIGLVVVYFREYWGIVFFGHCEQCSNQGGELSEDGQLIPKDRYSLSATTIMAANMTGKKVNVLVYSGALLYPIKQI